ncbi:MAG TPA: hypothetical protein PLV87_17330 [Opitutaceae bacterium]|nr:hypothetical protein [Opitutaceae bacterium]
MFRSLFYALFHRPTYRFGKVDNSRIRRTTLRNAQFVSFMSQQGLGRPGNPDAHDARLRRQRIFRAGMACAALGALIWIGIESAKALSMF